MGFLKAPKPMYRKGFISLLPLMITSLCDPFSKLGYMDKYLFIFLGGDRYFHVLKFRLRTFGLLEYNVNLNKFRFVMLLWHFNF